jgi:hypothetical protein
MTYLTIKYYTRVAGGRTTWGGLIPYDKVWLKDTHSATSIALDKDIIVNVTKISGGNWEQHVTDDYNSKDDILRADVAAEQFPSVQERLKYSITNKGNTSASLNVSWEKLEIILPIQLN